MPIFCLKIGAPKQLQFLNNHLGNKKNRIKVEKKAVLLKSTAFSFLVDVAIRYLNFCT